MRKILRNNLISFDFIAFKECNNNCSFCFQKNTENTSFIDQNDVVRRYKTLLSYIKQNYHQYSEIYIDMTGGELFFKTNLFGMYKDIIDLTTQTRKEIGKPIRILFGTNLLYEDTTLLYEVLEYALKQEEPHSLLRGVFTSFDFAGRFRSIDKVELHRRNTLELQKWLYERKVHFASVSVLTKMAIQKFINPKSDLEIRIKEIYDEYYQIACSVLDLKNENWWFRPSWTLMSPNTIEDEYTKTMVPTSQEILDFYKHLVDNYNKLAVVQTFYSKDLSLRCGGNCHVCKKDKIEKSCDSNIYGDEILSNRSNLHVESNDPLEIYKFLMKKYNCVSCKYFSHCYIRPCPVVTNLKTVEQGDFCWRKKVYEYVEEKQTT